MSYPIDQPSEPSCRQTDSAQTSPEPEPKASQPLEPEVSFPGPRQGFFGQATPIAGKPAGAQEAPSAACQAEQEIGFTLTLPEQAKLHTTGRTGWTYLRWIFLAVLLVAAGGLWTATQLNPKVADALANWIAQLQQRSVSQTQREAEQAAGQILQAAGALVIDEGPEQGITSVHFMAPQALSDEALSQLERLVRLNSLNFIGMPITDRQLLYVAKVDSLASLVLNETPITDAGLAYLASLKQLEVLHLRKTAITDAGLVHLAPLQNLKVLDLSETQVTDQGLMHLQKLSDLRWLLLDRTAVTDAGLKQLEAFPRLTQINLRHTRVSPQGIDRLKKARPHLFVDHR
ncbi:MAG: hypothetical protein NZ602_08045 [Thermoguttaceae bacterium]|nr:hypothetical protein [Thermoguttaceae bacterium]MDW8038780.1 hypothetical protein [Thermoguttaceae bacterium]